MSTWSLSDKEKNRERFWRTPPKDPTRLAKNAGVPHYARRSITRSGTRVLMSSDFMPIGEHASKHLHAVPQDYLLWVNAQPWSKNWHQWQPVADYISRFIIDGSDSDHVAALPPAEQPLFFVDALRKWPTAIRCFQAGSSHLHCLPGHEDRLHAFAVGALGLDRQWYQNGKLPHYDLTVGKHQQALSHPCVQEIPDRQLIAHKEQWIQFFQTKPKLPQ